MEHLAGKRLLLTRAEGDNGPWIERLRSLDSEAVPFPCIVIEPLELSPGWEAHLEDSHWVAFTSHRSVLRFASLLEGRTLAAHQIAAVGPTTRAACMDCFGRCDLTASSGSALSLASALTPKLVPDAGVLLPGAADPRPELASALRDAGARPIPLPLYATRPASTAGERATFTREDIDAVLFASPSAVSGAFATATLPLDLPTACLGPTTAAAARAAGLTCVATSKTRDLDGLLTALKEHLTPNPQTR